MAASQAASTKDHGLNRLFDVFKNARRVEVLQLGSLLQHDRGLGVVHGGGVEHSAPDAFGSNLSF